MPARILVVEDNKENLDLMTYLLKAFGHDVVSAQDGVEGLELAGRIQPDLILCDLQMPKKDGYEVARTLKSHATLRSVRLVAVTAFAMVGDRDKVIAAGFDGYIPKPIDPEKFVQLVEGFLPSGVGQDFNPARHEATGLEFCLTPPGPNLVSKRCRILVIDDAPANLYLARSVLEPSGYEVVTAGGMHK